MKNEKKNKYSFDANKEKELVKLCVGGDRASQKEFYELHCRKVLGICVRYFKDKSEAEDTMQETFIKAFDSLKTFKGDCPIGGWLRRIAVNIALDKIKKKNTWNMRSSYDDIEKHTEPEEVLNDEEIKSINVKKIVNVMHSLPDGLRTVFNLRVVEGYSHKEIASMLGIKEGTSKSQYFKAKSNIRKSLCL